MQKTAWLIFTLLGNCAGVAWVFAHGLSGRATIVGVIYLLVVLSWGYKLDPEAAIARDQWAEHGRRPR